MVIVIEEPVLSRASVLSACNLDLICHNVTEQQLITRRLLGIRSSFLEDFLVRGTKKQPETIVMFDLLWKHYEKTRSYACAAKILSKLADRHSTEVNIYYLSY